jgi:tetratricopeptide (TPR) repeat protein
MAALGEGSATPPTALISYSHDSPEHEHRVLELCNRLRARGVEATIDQFLPGAPSEGWPLWMERQIESRDFTLMLCTENYLRRFMEGESAGVGRGVVWEARILRNLLYDDSERHARIVPLLFESAARQFVPTVFRGHYYDLSDDLGFENLLRHLLREPGAEAAALGSLGPQGSRWSAFERPWIVPDAMRTRYFTGRDTLIDSLRRQLTERHRAALSGLGGVGKTQTAIEYAVRHRADYPDGVFWTNAETPSGLTSGFIEIAKALRLNAAASSDQAQIIRATMEFLNGTHRWLLIFDNVSDRGDVQQFLPERGTGDVLITSRESVFQEIGIPRALNVIDLGDDEAVSFLLKRTGRDGAGDAERHAASELAAELGNLPLALEQAGAYIAETIASLDDYLAAFRKRRVTVLEKASGLVSRDTVAVTWSANFEAVELASHAAADALRISAFLAPDAIPFEAFSKGAASLGASIAAALADPDDPLAIGEMLRPLARYSLIRSDPQSRTYGVHRLVQEIVRDAMSEPDRRAWIERAIGALDAAIPEVRYETWEQCDRLVPHVASISKWMQEYDIHLVAVGRILNQAAQALYVRGRFSEVEPLFAHALATAEREFGPDHPDVAKILNNLGILFAEQAKYTDSQRHYERALRIMEVSLGPDHPAVLTILNNLSAVFMEGGRFADAQPPAERALAGQERVLGPDHLDLAKTLNNLGAIHTHFARYDQARAMHSRALTLRERVLGPDHPDVAYSLNNLANVDVEEGRYAESLPLNERALAIRERVFGHGHREVATSLSNLAGALLLQGSYDEAQPLFERALEIWERTLGPDHTFVAHPLNGLGTIHRKQGRASEARASFERALAIQERAVGSDRPDVAQTLYNLGWLNAEVSRFVEAETSFTRAMSVWERAFGSTHPKVAASLYGLASVYEHQGRNAAAIPLLERVLAIRERVFIVDAPDAAGIRALIDAARVDPRDSTS